MNKKRKALIRERDKQARIREELAVEAKAVDLTNQVGGFSRRPQTKKELAEYNQRKFIDAVTFQRVRQVKEVVQEVSGPTHIPLEYEQPAPYDGDMLDRELAALDRYKQMKKRTGPVYNKGGNQYFTDDMLADMKTGSLRRR